MLFSSFSFLFWFLPATLALYFLPVFTGWEKSRHALAWHNAVLLAASLFFYAWGEPIYVLLLLGSVAVNAALAALIVRVRHPKAALIAAVCFNVGALIYFKYLPLLGPYSRQSKKNSRKGFRSIQ